MKTFPSTKRFSIFRILASSLCLLASGALSAATINWVSGTVGDWANTDNWQGGILPTSADHIFADSGTITVATNIIVGDSGTSASTGTTGIGATAGQSSALIISSGGRLVTDNNIFAIGDAGSGYLEIQEGGILQTGGYIYANKIGNQAGSSGTVVIKNGGLWESYGGIYVGEYGTGLLHVETGGTLTIAAGASLYLGERVEGSGTAIIDGYFETGKNASGALVYQPIGKNSTTVSEFIVGTTGTVRTAQLEIAMNPGSAGSATIAGRWDATAGTSQIGYRGEGSLTIKSGGILNHAARLNVGNSGTGADHGVGTITVEQGGILNFTAASGGNFVLGMTGSAVGTAHIYGTVRNVNTLYIGESSAGNNSLYIYEGGYVNVINNSWYARNPTVGGVDGSTLSGTNAAYIAGTWDTGGYLVIGNNDGHNILDIATTGTVIVRTTGIRLTYAVPGSTADVNVDGYMEAAGSAYIIVAHYGNSYMRVGATGTAIAGGYISIGQGDYWNNTAAPSNYRDSTHAYSGIVDVEGYMKAGTQLQVANRLPGTLNIATTGTVIAGAHGIIGMGNDNSPNAFGTVNVAGLLQIGTYLTNGNNGYGYLDIKKTGTVTAGGNYTQNARSTLAVELSNSRAPDTVDSELTEPLIIVNGAATLSGTLFVYGDVSGINYTGGGGGKASELTGIPVLRAAGGISGDFSVVEINGITIPTDLPDYIRGGGLRVNEGGPVDTRYDVGYGLAWKSSAASANGIFTVKEGATFDVDVQLSDRPGIAFATGWDGISLTKAGPGTLILSVENAYTGATTIESGTLRFTGPVRHTVGTLVNNGVVDFYATGTGGERIGGYRTIQASSLAGNGSYRIGVDLFTGASDRLIIDGDAYGTHRLLITGTAAGLPRGDEPMPTLVTIGGVNGTTITGEGEIIGSGTITTFSGNFDYGLFKYEVQTLGNRVVIVNTGLAPDVFEHINGVPGSQSVLWFDQQDNISRRLGELRAPREGGTDFDIWARGHASSSTIGGGESEMLKSDVDIWGAEIGSDYTWKFDDQHATVGVYLGIGNASQKFERIATALSDSTGESDVLGIGVYASWLADSGWFANATASMAQYKNSFDSVDGSKNHTTADYKDHGFGAAIEGGRRFEVSSNGWFVEPAVQGAAVRLTRADYIAVNKAQNYELSVHGSDITVTRLRGAIRVGRAWKAGRAGWMEIAGRFGATRERSSGGEVVITSAPVNRWRPNLDGNRYEAGVGFFWQPFETGQLYFDYEYASGDNFTKPWGISLGFRLSL